MVCFKVQLTNAGESVKRFWVGRLRTVLFVSGDRTLAHVRKVVMGDSDWNDLFKVLECSHGQNARRRQTGEQNIKMEVACNGR